ncbi:MAG: hypothetical protein EOM62_17115 [Bacteroidia bacterium]|nr:hypothetical protein [Bacteroidia bacterium]
MYVRYKDPFGKTAMFLYPLFYCVAMSWYLPCSATIISEQLQAPGMVILLLEFLLFLRTRKMSLKSSFWISLSIVFSFGTTFVSIYSIFVIAFAVALIELRDCFQKKVRFVVSVKYLFQKYWLMLLLVLAPFILLCLIYLIKGTLDDFIFGAYKINRLFYPKYTNGFGTSALSIFFQTVDSFISYFSSTLSSWTTSPLECFRTIIMIFSSIWLSYRVFLKDKIAGLLTIYYIIMCAPRGFVGFHSMGYYAVCIIAMCILAGNLYERMVAEGKIRYAAILVLCAFAFSTSYLGMFSSYMSVPYLLAPVQPSGYAAAIKTITNEDDKIYIPNFNIEMCLDSNRLPLISSPASTPWTYEALGDKELATLAAYRPKVIIYDENFEVWGYRQVDYATEIVTFIKGNYCCLSTTRYPLMYVRNDLIEAARTELGIAEEESILTYGRRIIDLGDAASVIGPITDGNAPSQDLIGIDGQVRFISFMVGTYARVNRSSLTIRVEDLDNKKVLAQTTISAAEMPDNSYVFAELPFDMQAGAPYRITFESDNADPGDAITIYCTQPSTATDEHFATVSNVKQDNDLCIRLIEYKN